MKRCFIALEPPPEVKKELGRITKELVNKTKSLDLKVKWVDEQNLHITLKFLGYIDEKDISKIDSTLREILRNKREISCELHEMGFFPNDRFPRVIWVGVLSNNEVETIASEINNKLSEIGFSADKKFVSHITIGRVKFGREKRKLKDICSSMKIPPLRFKIREVTLMESVLTPAGPEYHTIKKYRLGD